MLNPLKVTFILVTVINLLDGLNFLKIRCVQRVFHVQTRASHCLCALPLWEKYGVSQKLGVSALEFMVNGWGTVLLLWSYGGNALLGCRVTSGVDLR